MDDMILCLLFPLAKLYIYMNEGGNTEVIEEKQAWGTALYWSP